MQETSLSYEQLEQAFACDEKLHFSAELHGYISGLICGTKSSAQDDRFSLALDRLKEEDCVTQTHQKILAQLMIETFQQLQDEHYSFQLLLPREGIFLKLRLKALIRWCQGFLSGLGDAGITEEDIEKKGLKEALNDIFEITTVQYNTREVVAGDQHAEFFYIDLVEHVKVSVMLIYTENVVSQNNC